MASLRITEIFYSLQGESSLIGLPTVFIRLTGCPLRCGYCDTSYAFTGGTRLSLAEIRHQIRQFKTRYATVTGGEPLAQPECHKLLKMLADEAYTVSLETSGALDIAKVDGRVIKIMDLKTPSSGEMDKNRYQNIGFLTAQDQVKFVIGNDEDYAWSKAIIEQHVLNERCQILFSPVQGQQDPTELAEKILRDQLPVRFQIQLHKYLWGNAQGK